MYCPKCGQPQSSDEIRFCSQCGFALTLVSQLLVGDVSATGLAIAQNSERNRLSARQKGLRQGVLMLFLGAILTPIAGIISAEFDLSPILFAIIAVIGILGGILRMLYAVMFEERHASPEAAMPPLYMPPRSDTGPPHPAAIGQRERLAVPPPTQQQQPIPVSDARAQTRHNTAEMVGPPASVTENTTRLLIDPPESGRG